MITFSAPSFNVCIYPFADIGAIDTFDYTSKY